MSKSLALLSGKGGSGKTTLALSIASLLSKCNLAVLYIDCDFSTNGATYFFEDKINEKTQKLDSFFSYFSEQEEVGQHKAAKETERKQCNLFDYESLPERGSFIKVDENFDFLPSIVKLSKKNMEYYQFNPKDISIMAYLDNCWRQKYDAIIYDCQAGYSSILKCVLPYVDVNLVVMEADAISAVAIRSLYLRIGSLLNDKKIYQVFNKITEEEYDIYSKVSGGTIFTNIESVMFDWKIRKAFYMAEIPEISNAGGRYGQQVFNVCNLMFKEEKIQNALEKYRDLIRLKDIKFQEQTIRESIKKYKDEKQKKRALLFRKIYISFVPIFIIVTSILLYTGLSHGLYNRIFNLVLSVFYLLVAITYAIALIASHYKNSKKDFKEETLAYKKLGELEIERISVETNIEKRKDEDYLQKNGEK